MAWIRALTPRAMIVLAMNGIITHFTFLSKRGKADERVLLNSCYDLFFFLLIYFLFCLSLCTTPCLALFAFLCACLIAYLCMVIGHILHYL